MCVIKCVYCTALTVTKSITAVTAPAPIAATVHNAAVSTVTAAAASGEVVLYGTFINNRAASVKTGDSSAIALSFASASETTRLTVYADTYWNVIAVGAVTALTACNGTISNHAVFYRRTTPILT